MPKYNVGVAYQEGCVIQVDAETPEAAEKEAERIFDDYAGVKLTAHDGTEMYKVGKVVHREFDAVGVEEVKC